MSAEVATNNNPNGLNGENKIKYEKLKKQLETPIETRINVNFCLLVYWLPAYIIDLSAQFPTYNGTHIFTDFLSNWGQTVILFHLVFSLSMDLSGEDFRKKMEKSLQQDSSNCNGSIYNRMCSILGACWW